MPFATIQLEYHDHIAILTFNRPDVFNSLSVDVAQEVLAALDQIRQQPHIHALVVTGAGKAFCAGAELTEALMNGQGQRTAGEVLNEDMLQSFNPWIAQLSNFHLPIVVAVNGVAAGAGIGIALAGDITIAAESSFFLMSFAPKLGLIPDLGSSWQLPRLIGLARTKALTLLGDQLSAQLAQEWGLIWQCVPDAELLSTAMAIATKLARLPAHVALEVRRTYAHSVTNSLEQQLDYERQQQCQFVELPSFQEGVNAFKQKRSPDFKK